MLLCAFNYNQRLVFLRENLDLEKNSIFSDTENRNQLYFLLIEAPSDKPTPDSCLNFRNQPVLVLLSLLCL